MTFSKKQIIENHARLQERNKIHKQFGYDVRKSLRFVLSQVLPVKGRVLEIGTGKGRFTVECAKKMKRLTTLDLDPGEQKYAKLNAAYEGVSPKVRFVSGDATKLPWKRPAFDCIVSVNTLHHLHDPVGAIREMIRVTRPDGKVVLSDFSKSGLSIMAKIHKSEGRVHDHICFRWRDLERVFRGEGWTVNRFKGYHQEGLVATGPEGI